MNVLAVHAHPVPNSYSAHVRDVVVEGLRWEGHEVEEIRLYDGDTAEARFVNAIVFLYPTWWSGPPSIVTSWLDRTWPDGTRTTRVRRLVVVTTHGSSKRLNALQGEAGKRQISRVLRARCHRRCRFKWISLYNMDRATDDRRTAFAEKARKAVISAIGR